MRSAYIFVTIKPHFLQHQARNNKRLENNQSQYDPHPKEANDLLNETTDVNYLKLIEQNVNNYYRQSDKNQRNSQQKQFSFSLHS